MTREFPIEGNLDPVDDAHMIIQLRAVNTPNHKIFINDDELPLWDLPIAPGASGAWLSWMEHIPPGYLKKGTNTIRIDRVGNDNFAIRGIVVHWREGPTQS